MSRSQNHSSFSLIPHATLRETSRRFTAREDFQFARNSRLIFLQKLRGEIRAALVSRAIYRVSLLANSRATLEDGSRYFSLH